MSSRAMRRLREEMGGGSDLPPAPQEEEGEEEEILESKSGPRNAFSMVG